MFDMLKLDFWKNTVERSFEWLVTSGPTILVICVLALVVLKAVNLLLSRFYNAFVKRGIERHDNADELEKRINTLSAILRSTIKLVVWLVVTMLVLRELGVDIAPIIAGAGIVGLAVGFGAQNLVRDFISGFFMLLENQIRTGDVAVINGTAGLVESINLRTTTLRDLSGVVHIFPNGTISSLSNMTKDWSAMVFDVGVAYKEDVDRVIEVMKAVAEDLRGDPAFSEKILEPLEVFGLDKFGDSAVVIKARLKTKPLQQWVAGREYNRRLKNAFDEKGIEIPFPQRTLHWGEGMNALSVLLKNAGGNP